MNDYEDKVLEGVYRHIAKAHVDNVAEEFDTLSKKAEKLPYPDELNDWFAEFIKQKRARDRRKKIMDNLHVLSKRVAVFLIIIVLGLVVTTLSVEALRVRVFNFITEVTEKYTSISIVKDDDIVNHAVDWQNYYAPSYTPSGYVFHRSEQFDNLKIIFYQNNSGQIIQFSQTASSTHYQVDTENAEVVDINVRGENGLLIKKEKLSTIVWVEEGMSFSIIGELNDYEIKKMAESIKYFKK